MPSTPVFGAVAPFAMFAFAGVQQLEVDRQTQLAHSMGAVLIGSLIALLCVRSRSLSFYWPLTSFTRLSLSGAVSMQVFLYFQLYPRDVLRFKVMVSVRVLATLESSDPSV